MGAWAHLHIHVHTGARVERELGEGGARHVRVVALGEVARRVVRLAHDGEHVALRVDRAHQAHLVPVRTLRLRVLVPEQQHCARAHHTVYAYPKRSTIRPHTTHYYANLQYILVYTVYTCTHTVLEYTVQCTQVNSSYRAG